MKTRKRLCASCLNFNFNKTLKVNKKQHPKWLSEINYVKEFIKKYDNFSVKYPNKYNKILKMYVNKKYANRKILYWAAKKPNNDLLINDAKTAYGSFQNRGVTQIDKYGFAVFKFDNPQNYKTIEKNNTKNKTYFKHIHFVISNNTNDSWQSQIYTKLVHNNYKFKDFLKKLNLKETIILNVLPCNMYAKEHIPNTYNLPFKDIKKMTTNEINKWLKEIIELHYPILKKLIMSKKMEYYELPIICYCAHNKCSASKIGCENLMKKGFVNVSLYEDGMKGYNSYNKK